MELLLLGLLGQVVALRLLAVQLARTPDDPPLLAHRPTDRQRRVRRHQRLLRLAIGGFVIATATSAIGMVLVLR